MITLITGLPGNGKTLFALWLIKTKAEKEKREVFYHNIKDLNLGWTEFDPKTWMDLPHGSIVVIDECQDIFPKQPNGKTLPDYYSELAKHRHKGFDIFLITQHPTLIDNFVRQLVGQHYHSIRTVGMPRSTIYEWSAANPAPQNASSQKSAITMKFAYPKEVYSWYKSAEVHTVKRSVPFKLILAVLFIISVIAGGWYALDRYQGRTKRLADGAASNGAAGVVGRDIGGVVGSAAGAAKTVVDPVADAKAFIFASTPRVAGLPQTAPKYDKLTEPVRVPVPAACIQVGRLDGPKGVRCKCYTQQGTPMGIEISMCMEFARNGFFQDFDADRDKLAQQRTDRGVQALSDRPESPVQADRVAVQRGPSVVALAMVPDAPKVPVVQREWGH